MKKSIVKLLAAAAIMSLGLNVTQVSAHTLVKTKAEEKKETTKEGKETTKEDTKADKENAEGTVTVEVQGDKISIPVEYKELEELGWKIHEDDAGEVIPSQKYTYGTKLVKDGKEIKVKLLNNKSKKNIPVEEGLVVSIVINQQSYIIEDTEKIVEYKWPKDLDASMSKDDILKLYGEPTRMSTSGDSTYITYQEDDSYYNGIEIVYDNKAKKIESIEINKIPDKEVILENIIKNSKNDKDDEGGKKENKKSNSTTYEMGENILDFTIKVGDSVLKIPSDFADFEGAGFTLHPDNEGERVPAGKSTYGTTLLKDKVEIKVSFMNEKEEMIPIEETKGIQLVIDNSYAVYDASKYVTFELPKGITDESTYDDVKEAYGEPASKNSYSDRIYVVYGEDYKKQVQIIFNKKTNKIISVEFKNDGKEE